MAVNKEAGKCLPLAVYDDLNKMTRFLPKVIAETQYEGIEAVSELEYVSLMRAMDKNPAVQRMISLAVAVGSWYRYKQIYSFNPEFFKFLTDQGLDQEINVEFLQQVPVKAFFIEPLDCFVNFVRFAGRLFIRFHQIKPQEKAAYAIELHEGWTLRQALDEYEKLASEADDYTPDLLIHSREVAEQAMLATLYLCSVGADINPVKKQVKKTKKGSVKIKDPNKAVKKAVVGEVVTRTLRVAAQQVHEKEESERKERMSSSGWTQRPHMRRAHWHTYRIGQGRKQSVIKWIPPVIVHGSDDLKVTRTLVKTEKKKKDVAKKGNDVDNIHRK